jgi:hypothetical protein
VISGKNHYVLRLLRTDRVDVLINGVGGALIPLVADPLHGREDFNELPDLAPEYVPALPDMAVERERLVLSEDVDAPEIGVEAVGKSDIDDPIYAPEGHCGLGAIPSEGIKSLAGTSC